MSADTLLFNHMNAPESSLPLPHLTPRECEVLRLMAHGKGRKGAARELGVSLGRVKACLSNAHLKLGASDTFNAVGIAVRLGLIEPPTYQGPMTYQL